MKTNGLTTAAESAVDREKKSKALRAAKELFGRYGFRKTTVDEIAEAAGMSKRTVYEVLKSKENILAELVMAEALAFRRQLVEELKQMIGAAAKLMTFCSLSRRFFEENPFLGQVMFDPDGLYRPFLGDEIQIIEDGMREIIVRILREGVREGAFRKMDIPGTAEVVFVLMRGFTYHRGPRQVKNPEWAFCILRAVAPEPELY